MKKVFIVGSTGALGKEALNVIRNHTERFELIGITGFNNYKEAIKQCIEFKPNYIGVRDRLNSFIKNSCNFAHLFDV